MKRGLVYYYIINGFCFDKIKTITTEDEEKTMGDISGLYLNVD